MGFFPLKTTSKVVLGISFVTGLTAVTVSWYLSSRRAKSETRKLDLIREFQKSSIHMKEPEEVEKKLAQMVRGGKGNVQVIADFDRTMSRYKFEGKLVPTCHNTLQLNSIMPDWFKEQVAQLLHTYYPIEIDPKKTVSEKYPFMVEWWTKAHALIVQTSLTRKMLDEIVQEAVIILRDGTEKLMRQLARHDIPLLIFSAGVGDIIELTLQHQHLTFNNVKIVSNFIDFNHQGAIVGFKGDLIHVFNKNECAVHKTDYFERQGSRSNILLLGDSLGDLHMAEGAKGERNILKIGFLNDKVEERLSSYLDGFDIVLVSDETMDLPNAILNQVLQS